MVLKKKVALRKSKKLPAKKPLRERLTPEARKAQLIDSAARMVVEQGFLPLPIERLAKSVGVSKALVYTYFPEPYDLINALLERELTGLLSGGLDVASQVDDIDKSAVLCAMLYFEHVARYGPLLHILLSDRYMVGHVERRLIRLRNVTLIRLARLAQRSLPLSKREVLAAIEMMTSIPEESGRLVFHQEIEATVAQKICRSLMMSALKALREPERALASVSGGSVRRHDIA
jgi:AcrR family transcriptional regulator